jgi:glycosyltransferase involved in cell wall biosynthesis
MTRISVIMPVFNCAGYVEAAIASILDQTYTDFEFIIIDDGSTDQTGKLVDAAAARDARIHLISRENRGISPSLNEGLALARGEYVARMDGDDIALPERFATQIAFLDANPECGLVGTQIMFVDPEGRPLIPMQAPLTHDAIVSTMMRGRESISHPTVMFRRKQALEIGGYLDRFVVAQDIDFFLRMADKAGLANLPDMMLHYRQHLTSVGRTQAALQAKSHTLAIVEAAARMKISAPDPVRIAEFKDVVDDYARWAWWALGSRYLATARHYAGKVLRARPIDRESWRLMFCVLRGR